MKLKSERASQILQTLQSQNATRAAKCIKLKLVVTEQTRQMTPGKGREHLPSAQTKKANTHSQMWLLS